MGLGRFIRRIINHNRILRGDMARPFLFSSSDGKVIIDISFWQRPSAIDYEVLSANIDGVILRGAYGTGKDTQFETHYENFHRRNVPIGVYHYIIGSENIRQQAEAFNSFTKGKELKLGRWMDVEDIRPGTKVSRNQILEYASINQDMNIYTSKSRWQEIMGAGTYLTDRDMWVAHYKTYGEPLIPNGWNKYKLWQWTDKGRLPGYLSNLDMSRFNGRDYNWNEWVGGEESPAEPPEKPPVEGLEPMYLAKVTARLGLIVRTGPGLSYPKAKPYGNPFGTILPVYEEKNGWKRVHPNKEEWSMGTWLERLSEEVPPAEELVLYEARVNTIPPNRLAVREGPGTSYKRLRWLSSGDAVSVYQEKLGWGRIGHNEWSMLRWLKKTVDDKPGEPLIPTGLLQLELWSQRDPKWASDKMGNSNITLGEQGCLVTCVASVMKYFGIETDPKDYNHLLSNHGGYAPPNLMYWLMPEILWKNKVKRTEYKVFYGKGWETTAKQILAEHRPAIAQVDFIPGGVMNQHWVVLIGEVGGVWWCYDPWYGSAFPLKDKYDEIYRIAGYKKL